MDLNRRTFVKGCVGVAGAGALGAIAAGGARPVSDVRVTVRPITYPGIHVVKGSPAPYGLPLIPTHINDRGELEGIPDAVAGQLDWYRYCGREEAPGLSPEYRGDSVLRYFAAEDRLDGPFWYRKMMGRTARAEDFPGPGAAVGGVPGPHGAPLRWRSAEGDSDKVLAAITILLPRRHLQFGRLAGFQQEQLEPWFPSDPRDPANVFVTFSGTCTHFCCVPGWREDPDLIDRTKAGYPSLFETLYCACHGSAYDPRLIQTYDRNIFVFESTT